MAWATPMSKLLLGPQIDYVEMTVSVIDTDPDEFVYMRVFQEGAYIDIDLVLKNGAVTQLIPSVLPSVVTLIGCKSDNAKAYIAIGVDVNNSAVLRVIGVDESGVDDGGGTGDDYRVAGTVQINGVPAQRDIVIISDSPTGRTIVGEGESGGDGAFELTYSGWSGPVIVVALDGYGLDFPASAPLNMGDVIHPTSPNGYVYVVTEPGMTGSSEPLWSTSGSVTSGGVTFMPRVYFRPVASGPLQGELVE